MADYKLDKTLFLEERGIQFLKSIGFNIEANNLGDENKTKIDYKLYKDKNNIDKGLLFIDFQFSADFALYGDIRIDILSAYHKKNEISTNNDIYAALKIRIILLNQII